MDHFRRDALALAGVTATSALALLTLCLLADTGPRARFTDAPRPARAVRTAALHGFDRSAPPTDEAPDEASDTAREPSGDERDTARSDEVAPGSASTRDEVVDEELYELGISCCGDEWYSDDDGWRPSGASHRYSWRWGRPRRFFRNGDATVLPWMGAWQAPETSPASAGAQVPLGVGTLRSSPSRSQTSQARVRREGARWLLENARVALTLDLSGACLSRLVAGATGDAERCTVEETAVPWNDREGAALQVTELRNGVRTTVQVSLGDDDARPTVTGESARRDGDVTLRVFGNEGDAAMTWAVEGREVTVPAGRSVTVRVRS